MEKADINGDGEIDYNELMDLIKEISKWTFCKAF
jgi:Ca2+-binding EF-hand superfamily protein